VINLAGVLRRSNETGNQIHGRLVLQWDETKDETLLEKRFGRPHENRPQVWWLSPTIETGSDFSIGITRR
jgi:hypothetical protein